MKHFAIVILAIATLVSLISCGYMVPEIEKEPEDVTLSREEPVEDVVTESLKSEETADESSEDFQFLNDEPSFTLENSQTSSHFLTNDFHYIFQMPELPTGCEITSLAMVLEYYGYPIDKIELSRKYLPKENLKIKDGVLYGPDPNEAFVGDPEDSGSYGCYAQCIVETANAYFKDNNISKTAVNVSGESLDELLSKYVTNDIPIIIWVTSSELHEPTEGIKWTLPDGSLFQWKGYEHCVVLRGCNSYCNLVYISDPLAGHTMHNYTLFEQRYEQMGMQAVVIVDTNQGSDLTEPI